jgi:hypothetical protein
MAKIDRQLASLSDEELLKAAERDAVVAPGAPGAGGAGPKGASKSRGGAVTAAAAPASVPAGRLSKFGLIARITLTAALAGLMLFWPYPARCGLGLAGYLGATAVLVSAGVWSAIWAWRHRAPKVHMFALALMGWGLTLGAVEILPRIGYAIASDAHPATWVCR